MRTTETHVYFWGSEYSQWYASKFEEKGKTFVTAEQYMMYHKAMTFGDTEIAEKILATEDPRYQKELGRAVKGFNNEEWDKVKFDIVVRGNVLKFGQSEDLREMLLVTHKDKIFVEASPHDFIWGIGLHESDDRVLNESTWKGQNLLGKAINEAQRILLEHE